MAVELRPKLSVSSTGILRGKEWVVHNTPEGPNSEIMTREFAAELRERLDEVNHLRIRVAELEGALEEAGNALESMGADFEESPALCRIRAALAPQGGGENG